MVTEKEMNRIKALNRRNHYCLSLSELKTMCKRHKKVRTLGDTHAMELIEWRLTDINFHHECGLLSQGFYDEIEKMTEL